MNLGMTTLLKHNPVMNAVLPFNASDIEHDVHNLNKK